MWEKIAKEMALPWRAAEAMHWQIGEFEMANRANVPVFHLAGQQSSQAAQLSPSTPTILPAIEGKSSSASPNAASAPLLPPPNFNQSQPHHLSYMGQSGSVEHTRSRRNSTASGGAEGRLSPLPPPLEHGAAQPPNRYVSPFGAHREGERR